MATIFSMIFVLMLMLFLGFTVFNNAHKNGIVKYKLKKLKICFVSVKQSLYFSPANIFFYESKSLLECYTRTFAKLVDDVLAKVRLLAPQGDLSNKELLLRKKKIGEKAIFLMNENMSEICFKAVEVALDIEDFFPVCFVDKQTNFFEKYTKINFFKSSNKEFVSLCKKLNINLYLPSLIQCYFLKENFNFSMDFKQGRKLGESYLLTRFENNDFNFLVYNFFAGETLSICICENKLNKQNNLDFNFFYDLANDNLNYFDISYKNNFAIIKDELKQEINYLNFSLPPKTLKQSCLKSVEKSNLPCVDLSYNLNLLPKQKLQFAFMLCKSPRRLDNLNLKTILKTSKKKLEEFFNINLVFSAEKENNFLNNEIMPKAKVGLLTFGKKNLYSIVGDYALLKNKYLNNEIDALCFYISVKSQLLEFLEIGVKINPNFIKENYKIMIKGFQNAIHVVQKNLKVPCLVLDGVRYYNHLLVKYNSLSSWEAKIEC